MMTLSYLFPPLPLYVWQRSSVQLRHEKLGKLLGISWMRNNRLSPMSHITLFSFVKVMYQLTQMIDRVQEKNKLFGEQASVYGKFDES